MLRAWSDEGDALGRKPLGKADILRQESISGMNGLRPGQPASGDDCINIQIAIAGGCGTEADRFVSEKRRHGKTVRVGINGDGGDAHLFQCPDYADGDFASIGDENFTEHFSSPGIGGCIPDEDTDRRRIKAVAWIVDLRAIGNDAKHIHFGHQLNIVTW